MEGICYRRVVQLPCFVLMVASLVDELAALDQANIITGPRTRTQ